MLHPASSPPAALHAGTRIGLLLAAATATGCLPSATTDDLQFGLGRTQAEELEESIVVGVLAGGAELHPFRRLTAFRDYGMASGAEVEGSVEGVRNIRIVPDPVVQPELNGISSANPVSNLRRDTYEDALLTMTWAVSGDPVPHWSLVRADVEIWYLFGSGEYGPEDLPCADEVLQSPLPDDLECVMLEGEMYNPIPGVEPTLRTTTKSRRSSDALGLESQEFRSFEPAVLHLTYPELIYRAPSVSRSQTKRVSPVAGEVVPGACLTAIIDRGSVLIDRVELEFSDGSSAEPVQTAPVDYDERSGMARAYLSSEDLETEYASDPSAPPLDYAWVVYWRLNSQATDVATAEKVVSVSQLSAATYGNPSPDLCALSTPT